MDVPGGWTLEDGGKALVRTLKFENFSEAFAFLSRVAMHETVPSAYDWRIERWAGEACIELSSVQWEAFSEDSGGTREPYRAREADGWRVEPGRCGEA